jgi:hypothetical protein
MPNGPARATNIAPRFNNNAGSQAGPRRNTPDNGFGAPRGEKGYGEDTTFKMMGGQLTVGNKSGARSWLGTPESDTMMPGVHTQLTPMGTAKNGFQQFGYTPDAQPGQAGYQQFGRTPYAAEGMDRAGYVTPNGWDPKGRENTQTFRAMQSAISGAGERPRPGSPPQTDVRPNGQPIGSGGRPGGVPHPVNVDPGFNKGGQGPGGRPNPRGNNSPGGMPGKGGGGRQGYPGTGTPGSMGNYANFPAPQKPAEDFLPMTPQFEAGRRGLADEQMGQQTDILAQRAMIDPMYQQALSRLQTDQTFDTDRLKEQLAQRGVYTPYGANGQVVQDQRNTGGGVGQTMFNRNIEVPYGRQYSDLATGAANAYGQTSQAYGDTEMAYNQGLAELLLNRASDASQNISMGVPQWSTGGRNLRGQNYTNRPQGPGSRKSGRRNRGRK